MINKMPQTSNRITGSRKWWALATVLLTMFFSSMDQTVVSTAMPTIIGDLHGFSLYAWVFTAYMMASAISIPIYGKLSDVFGRKPFYLMGLLLFGIGSAVSGQSHTMMELIFARAFQGIGAGAMMSMPRATVGDIFTPQERGRWMGIIGAVYGISSIVGPTLGGWITDAFSWRWVFYINLPFAIMAIIGVMVALPKVRTERQAKIDWLGSFLLIIGLMPILLGFTWAGSTFAWDSVVELSLFSSGVFLLAVFFLWERKASDPLLTPHLFKNRMFIVSLMMGMLVGMTMFGAVMFLPIYIQGVIGLNAQNSGWTMTPMMLGFIFGSIIAGQIMSKTGKYQLLARSGGLILVVGVTMLTLMNAHTLWITVAINMLILGIGIGSSMPILSVLVQNSFPYQLMGTVNSSQQFVNSLSGVVVSPIFGSLLTQYFNQKLTNLLPPSFSHWSSMIQGASPQQLLTIQSQQAIAKQFSRYGIQGTQMDHLLMNAVKISLVYGIHHLLLLSLIFSIFAFVGTFFIPHIYLKGKEFFEEQISDSSIN